jgi:hypothetical protein
LQDLEWPQQEILILDTLVVVMVVEQHITVDRIDYSNDLSTA